MADAINQPAIFIPNECFAYIDYYRNKATADNLKKSAINFYIGDERLLAKYVLWDNIFTAFKRIDELKLNAPSLVTRHLDRLPRHGPEEINVFSLANRISTIKRELAVVNIDVGHIKTKPVLPQPPMYASAAATNVPINTNDRSQAIYQRPATNGPQQSAQVMVTLISYADLNMQYRPASMNPESFAIVHNRRFCRQERVNIVGNKQSDRFQGCHPRMDLFVSPVSKEYLEQYIRDMIADTGVTLIEVNKPSHDNAMMTSYKVTVWRDDEECLMKPDAWPRFISCRR